MSVFHGELKTWEECLSGELLINPTNLYLQIFPCCCPALWRIWDFSRPQSASCVLVMCFHQRPTKADACSVDTPGDAGKQSKGTANWLSFRVMPKHWELKTSPLPPATSLFPTSKVAFQEQVCMSNACLRSTEERSLPSSPTGLPLSG